MLTSPLITNGFMLRYGMCENQGFSASHVNIVQHIHQLEALLVFKQMVSVPC